MIINTKNMVIIDLLYKSSRYGYIKWWWF